MSLIHILSHNCQYFSIDYIQRNVILNIQATKEYIKWVQSKKGLIYKVSFFLCSTSGLSELREQHKKGSLRAECGDARPNA